MPLVTSVWTRKSIFCAFEECQDKLIEQESMAFRVGYRTKNNSLHTTYFHFNCYLLDQIAHLLRHPQIPTLAKAGPGVPKIYTPEQSRVRRSLHVQFYNLMADRKSAVSIGSEDWMKVLNGKYERLMERYDNEAGGRPKTYKGFRL